MLLLSPLEAFDCLSTSTRINCNCLEILGTRLREVPARHARLREAPPGLRRGSAAPAEAPRRPPRLGEARKAVQGSARLHEVP